MQLTPEEKAVGKANFNVALGSKLTQRSFLMKGIQQEVKSGEGLGPYYFGYDTELADPVRVGVIGTGDEGSVLIGAINPKFIQVKAIADIRPYNVYRAFHGDAYSPNARKARPGLIEKYDWKTREKAEEEVKVYGAYQELIENAKDDELEAVIIALPLHLHAPAAIAAMKAGLHVLTEKLMGHSVRECKEMALVAKDTKLHLATGHQRHYNILYNNAVKAIAQGTLGELHYIRAQWHRGNLPGDDSWQQPLPRSVKPDDAQAHRLLEEMTSWWAKLGLKEKALADAAKKEADAIAKKRPSDAAKYKKRKVDFQKDVDLWKKMIAQKEAQISDETIKQAVGEKFGYEDLDITGADGKAVYHRPAIEELIRWRLWDRTGGGLMAELGSHQLDAASIFISAVHDGVKQQPLNVAAAANRPLFPPDRDVDDHVYCQFEFPAPGYDPEDPINSRRKISVAYASINGNGFGGYGETVFGTEGTLLLEREKEAMLYRTHETEGKIKMAEDEKVKGKGGVKIVVDKAGKGDPHSESIGALGTSVAERGYTEQLEHWAWCIRNPAPENKPKCHPEVALGDAVIALTTNIAAREGKTIEFKPEWFDIDKPECPENPDDDPAKRPDIKRYPLRRV